MNTKVIFIFGVIYQAWFAGAESKAPFITKCTPTDSQCIIKSARAALPILAAGIPELGVETLDPMHFKYLDASTPNLKLLLLDITFSGLRNCIIKHAERNTEQATFHMSAECTVDLDGKYEIEGQILSLPIQGAGDAHYRLNRIGLEIFTDFTEKTGEDGQVHIHSENLQYSYTFNDNPDIILGNLFNGDENLARAVESLLAINYKQVETETGTSIFDPIISRIFKNLQSFYDNVLMADLVIV